MTAKKHKLIEKTTKTTQTHNYNTIGDYPVLQSVLEF